MIGTTAHKRRRSGSPHGGAPLEPGTAPEAAPSGSPAPSHRLEQTDWNVSPGSGSDSVLDAANPLPIPKLVRSSGSSGV